MAFFLIVPSVIIVTIFLVHSIAERLGFKAKYFSLILCAVMSLAVNFAAIELSTYLDKWHYIRLGVLILVASLIVTLINRHLIKNEKTDVIIIDDIDEELALEEVEASTEAVKAVDTKETINQEKKALTALKEDKPTAAKTDKQDSKIESKPLIKPSEKSAEDAKAAKTVESKLAKDKKTEKPLESKKTEPKSTVEIVTDTKTVAASSPIKSTAKATKSDEKSIKTSDSKSSKSTDSEKKKPPSTVEDNKAKDKDKAQNKKSNDKAETKSSEAKAEGNINDINAHLGSLDDILDYAYAQKSSGDLKQAILAYQKALDRYRNDDYAPFIAIDLGNIYKEQAAYSKVIKTYEEALKLPVVMRNADTRREFTKNLTYMKIVQSVLVRHRALTMPFSKIPRQYLQEVESEFKSIQMNTTITRRRI